jgi:hypothetical protein
MIFWGHLAIVTCSVGVRVLLNGRTYWAQGRAIFYSAAVYLICTSVADLATDILVYKKGDSWTVIDVLSIAAIAAVYIRLRFIRYFLAFCLFIPGVSLELDALEYGWRGTQWDERLAFLGSLYVMWYLAISMAFSPSVAEFLRSPLRPRPPAGHCTACGYDLTGNVSGVCPECGRSVAGKSSDAAPPE